MRRVFALIPFRTPEKWPFSRLSVRISCSGYCGTSDLTHQQRGWACRLMLWSRLYWRMSVVLLADVRCAEPKLCPMILSRLHALGSHVWGPCLGNSGRTPLTGSYKSARHPCLPAKPAVFDWSGCTIAAGSFAWSSSARSPSRADIDRSASIWLDLGRRLSDQSRPMPP